MGESQAHATQLVAYNYSVMERQGVNKMSARNLGVVFGRKYASI